MRYVVADGALAGAIAARDDKRVMSIQPALHELDGAFTGRVAAGAQLAGLAQPLGAVVVRAVEDGKAARLGVIVLAGRAREGQAHARSLEANARREIDGAVQRIAIEREVRVRAIGHEILVGVAEQPARAVEIGECEVRRLARAELVARARLPWPRRQQVRGLRAAGCGETKVDALQIRELQLAAADRALCSGFRRRTSPGAARATAARATTVGAASRTAGAASGAVRTQRIVAQCGQRTRHDGAVGKRDGSENATHAAVGCVDCNAIDRHIGSAEIAAVQEAIQPAGDILVQCAVQAPDRGVAAGNVPGNGGDTTGIAALQQDTARMEEVVRMDQRQRALTGSQCSGGGARAAG